MTDDRQATLDRIRERYAEGLGKAADIGFLLDLLDELASADKVALSANAGAGQASPRARARRVRPEVEPPELSGMVRRVMESLVRRAHSGDIVAVEELEAIESASRDALVRGARGAHDGPAKYSWTEIAYALGVSRQAARERFGGSR